MSKTDMILAVWLVTLTIYAIVKPGRQGPRGFEGPAGVQGPRGQDGRSL